MGRCPACGRHESGGSVCPDDGAVLVADASDAGDAVGRQVDRYRILRKVGQGASSDVFEAEHIHVGKRVALKVLRRELAGDAHAVERLRREARTASAIGHPNIVHVEDFGVTGAGAVYIALEWLEGETLADRIERGPLAAAQAIDLALQMAAGLGAAHDAGVIHRDLKPANVFLVPGAGRPPRVVLLDFGIAKLMQSDSRLTRTGSFVGTHDYVAPEQALGDEVDARADLYALGVVLYQLLTGTLPFRAASFMVVLHRHTTEPPEPPSRRAPARAISPAVEAVVLRCLAKQREERFASAGDFARALAAAGRIAPGRAAVARLDDPIQDASEESPEEPIDEPLEEPPEGPPEEPIDEPFEDLIDQPRRGRLALRLAFLVMAGGAIGAVLALGGRGPRGRTASRDAVVEASGAPSHARAAGPVPSAPRSPSAPSAPNSPAAPAAPAASAPPARSAHAGVWTLPGRADGFAYTVWVRPRSVRPGQPFTLVVQIQPGPPLAGSWQRGAVTARLAFLHDRGHHVALRGEFPLDDRDRLSAALTLERAGVHRVELSLEGDGAELGRTAFDLCVGADPSGARADLARVCPRMAELSRLPR